MLATLSDESQIARILDEVGCAPSNFFEIANRCSISRGIAALKGQNDFNNEDAQYYLTLARELKRLATEYPVPISWKETQRIKQILATRNEGPPGPFAVVLISGQLFKRITAGEIETTTDYQSCAAFEDISVAYAAAKILSDHMHQIGVRFTKITNTRRNPETFVSKLADLGFEQ